jgi:NodT family efflux transporter outer membrane factor (OMF) lipoprotein
LFRNLDSVAMTTTTSRRAGGGVSWAFVALLLTGCVVGPDFKMPAAPDVSGYMTQPASTTVSTPGAVGGQAQRFVGGAEIAADWWTLFHSKPLNDLIEESLANNADLKAAQAALAVARETALAQRGVYYPNVQANFEASRQKQSQALAPTPNNNAFQYSLFTPQVSVSYALDIFGLNRRNTELVRAQEQAARFQMIAAHLTLADNVVAAAVEDASLRAQIAATRQLIDINAKGVEILKYQHSKGYAGGLDVAAQETQLDQVAATLPPLLKQAAAQHDLLAVLAGRFPSEAPETPFELSSLTLPQDLPLSLPSLLVAQRPDVRQAEANLQAASAQIGVAAANRLPNIALTANAGSTALAIGRVFAPGTGFWSLAGAASATVFDGGTLLHQERAAKAAYDQAAAQYRSTVLAAFQNVADTLNALEQDAEAVKTAAAAQDAAQVTLDLSQRQLKAGYAARLSLLVAEQAYQQARINLVQAQANRFADTAALFQALGGGWWRDADLAKDVHAG